MQEKANVPAIRFAGFTDAWEQREYGDVIELLSGQDFEPSQYNEVGDGIPYMTGASCIVNGSTIENRWTLVPRCIAYQGEVLLVCKGSGYGTLARLGQEKAHIARQFMDLRCTDVLNNTFNYYLAFSVVKEIKKNARGLIAGIDRSAILKQAVSIPQLAEQEKIGQYFSYLDHLITLHQCKYSRLCNIKKSMLEKMFPKEGASVPEIRFAGFTDAWEQRKLSELIVEYKETVEADCELPVLTSSKTEGVLLQEEHFGRKQSHDITGYNVLPRNYCTYRNRSDGIDFTFNINKCCDKGIISKFYPVFCGKDNDTFFISLVLNNSNEVVREIGYTCTGTGQKVLSFSDLLKMYLRVPNYEEQKKIAVYFDSLDHLITLHQRELERLQNIKKACLEKMFV